MWNALARLVVHLTAPGVPDVYQGDELWFQALVDPDNRRPVDWAAREERLESVRRACASGVGRRAAARRAAPLARRRSGRDTQAVPDDAAPAAPARGRGQALARGGYRADCGGRGARRSGARLSARRGRRGTHRSGASSDRALGSDAGAPIGARWGDTRLAGIDGGGVRGWRCLLSGIEVPAWDGALRVGDALAELPVALLAPAKSVMIVGATRGLVRSSVRYRTVARHAGNQVRFSIAAEPASSVASSQPVRQAVPSIDWTRSADQIFPAVPTSSNHHVVTEARTRCHAPRGARGHLPSDTMDEA